MKYLICSVLFFGFSCSALAKPLRPFFEGAFLWHGILAENAPYVTYKIQSDEERADNILTHTGNGFQCSVGLVENYVQGYVGFRYVDSRNKDESHHNSSGISSYRYDLFRWLDRRIFWGVRMHPAENKVLSVRAFLGGGVSVGWVRRTYQELFEYYHGATHERLGSTFTIESGATGGGFIEAGFIKRVTRQFNAILRGQIQVINLQLHDPQGYLSIRDVTEFSLGLGIQYQP
jgi:hypothetical protein